MGVIRMKSTNNYGTLEITKDGGFRFTPIYEVEIQ